MTILVQFQANLEIYIYNRLQHCVVTTIHIVLYYLIVVYIYIYIYYCQIIYYTML